MKVKISQEHYLYEKNSYNGIFYLLKDMIMSGWTSAYESYGWDKPDMFIDIERLDLSHAIEQINQYYELSENHCKKPPEKRFVFVTVVAGEIKNFDSFEQAYMASNGNPIHKMMINKDEIKSWQNNYKKRLEAKERTIQQVRHSYLAYVLKTSLSPKIKHSADSLWDFAKSKLYVFYCKEGYSENWQSFIDHPPFKTQELLDQYVYLVNLSQAQ